MNKTFPVWYIFFSAVIFEYVNFGEFWDRFRKKFTYELEVSLGLFDHEEKTKVEKSHVM